MRILNRQQILAAFDAESITPLLKQGFIAYSQRRVQQPPVQHFLFEQAAGDCCIKSAWLEGDELFVVKVSAGFYRNAERSLASNQGLVMAFSAQTGEPQALLQDEGWLTALRTALAGRIAAELCAPPHIQAIGMVGTGLQARLQLQCLKPVTDCRDVWVWGRDEQALAAYRREAEAEGFRARVTQDAAELAAHCQLIVTTTPSREPILQAADIRPGTHITAVGDRSGGARGRAAGRCPGAVRGLWRDRDGLSAKQADFNVNRRNGRRFGAGKAGAKRAAADHHRRSHRLGNSGSADRQRGVGESIKGRHSAPLDQALSTNFSIARATPSSVLALVTNCATAFSSGMALPIATPMPAYSIIAVSLA